jgi:hypothetical protein
MRWEELAEEFRSLGGVFENTRIGKGAAGRGVFVLDPARPAIVHTPRNLLVPIGDVEVRDGHLTLKAHSGIGARERAFFETYHRDFGWSAGLFDEIERQQSDWHQLPGDLKRLICTMGAIGNPENRFSPPTAAVCLKSYVETRDLSFEGKPHIAPMLEMVNHSPDGRDYATHDGLVVAGTFEFEVLARYNVRDAWSVALHYGFAQRSPYAYSLAIAVELYGGKRLSIGRDVTATRSIEGVPYPQRHDDDSQISLAHLMLGNSNAVDLPRAVFRNVMKRELTTAQADEVFDGLAFYNRQRFRDALEMLADHDGNVVKMLRSAASHQLHALSACVGGRAL